jgi:UDP-glucose:(heptosyl)LPS alpha-1,3-glucosyltransferase
MSEPWLRIAYVVHEYNRRKGHSRYVAELAERFAGCGHDVHVFAAAVDEPRPPGIHFHHVPAWRRRALTTILSFVLPATLLVRGRFDVIHAQGLCGLRQHVTTAHMCQAAWLDASRRVHGRLGWGQRLARVLVVPLERLTYLPALSSQVIAISEANRRDLAHFYRRTRDVTVIPHGIDLDRFHPGRRAAHRGPVRHALGVADDQVVALYVGDLKKGAEPALHALARTPTASLVVVSPTSPGRWDALARQLGVESHVHFCLETREVEQYYAAADLLLFPTFHDAFGLVITEAMGAGLPVITSASAGAAALIDHGRDGWLLRHPWDVDEVAAALGRLVEDAGLRDRMGAAARRTAERYTWDRVADETMAVYRRSVAARRRPPAR